jgi:hypothetical protein
MIRSCRRFLALSGPRRRLVCEAAALTAFILFFQRRVRFLTLRRLLRGVAAPAAAPSGASTAAVVEGVGSAVAAVAARVPAATCLVQALVADAMLRRRGVECQVRFGARPAAGGALPSIEGHAWVECASGAVVGSLHHHPPFEVLDPVKDT